MACFGCEERRAKILNFFGVRSPDAQQRLFNHFAGAIHGGANPADVVIAATNTIALALRQQCSRLAEATEQCDEIDRQLRNIVRTFYDASSDRRKEIIS